ncbi:3'-5' exonuclease [Rhodoblastus sp.]|uniref:3'-5' exonuclease n=1 Tax=Rhodoblastus sp. TaxID=1962975 RepID=UPI003F99AD65
MAMPSPPIFVDCEASDLDGYVIEVGWAVAPPGGEIIGTAHLVRPAPDWQIKDAWSRKAERLHGISLAELFAHGEPAQAVASEMNRQLAGLELYSDEPAYDRRWLEQLFEAAGIEPTFTVSAEPTRTFLEILAEQRNFEPGKFQTLWDQVRLERRHRADADALAHAKLWRFIMDDAEK